MCQDIIKKQTGGEKKSNVLCISTLLYKMWPTHPIAVHFITVFWCLISTFVTTVSKFHLCLSQNVYNCVWWFIPIKGQFLIIMSPSLATSNPGWFCLCLFNNHNGSFRIKQCEVIVCYSRYTTTQASLFTSIPVKCTFIMYTYKNFPLFVLSRWCICHIQVEKNIVNEE